MRGETISAIQVSASSLQIGNSHRINFYQKTWHMNWSELKNNKSHLFLNYLKIKADKFVKDTKCHLCLKSFGYKCTLVENELTS